MVTKHLKKYCRIGEKSQKLLEVVINKFGLSARAYDRILKVARIIADLASEENIKSEPIAEAIQYLQTNLNILSTSLTNLSMAYTPPSLMNKVCLDLFQFLLLIPSRSFQDSDE